MSGPFWWFLGLFGAPPEGPLCGTASATPIYTGTAGATALYTGTAGATPLYTATASAEVC